MTLARRGVEPDPWGASDQAEFRARLRDLLRWAEYASLQQLEAGAARRGTSMPVSTANRALNNDRLPTAEFVERLALACAASVKQWTAARDALADRPYLRVARIAGTAVDADVANRTGDASEICPYPGLAAFDREHAEWFFGREKVTAELLDLLVERLRGTGPLMIAGPSGAGKSSLLRAGILSALTAGRLPGSKNWIQLVLTPTVDPVSEMARQVAAHLPIDPDALTSALLSNPGHLAEVLHDMPGAEGDVLDRHPVTAVLVVDQFEEVFTLCSDEQHRQAFISALCAAGGADAGGAPAALVILGIRADFTGRCATYPGLVEAFRRGPVLLGPMTSAESREVIERPARAAGLELESGLVDVVLADLGVGDLGELSHEAGALPLLAHALLSTWQQRDGRALTISGYRLTGGITGAIAKTAERVYQQLSPDRREIARTVLLRMIQLGEESADTRRHVVRARLVEEFADPAGAEVVLETLTNARLVTAHATTVEIVHEALLREWPRLRAWIDNDRVGLLMDQRLVAAADAWDREGRHASDLYRGPRLAAVQERVDTVDPVLPSPTPEFLRASVERERAEQQAVAQRAGRLRQLVAVLSCLVLLAATTTVVAILSRNNLVAQSDIGVSRAVADAAVALHVSDPDLAAQLALAARDIADTPEARGALLTALVSLDPARRSDVGSTDAVQAAAFSHNGRFLVAGSRDRFARVWAVGDPPGLVAPPVGYLEHSSQVRSVLFDPTDRVLVTLDLAGMIRLWAVESLGRDEQPVNTLSGLSGGTRAPVAFSRTGGVLATGGTTGTAVRLWDITDPTSPTVRTEFDAHTRDVLAVAFSDDGRTLVTAGIDGTVKLWDVSDLSDLTEPPVQRWVSPAVAGYARAVAISPDGRLLAAGNGDASTTLWDIENPEAPRVIRVLAGHADRVTSVAFSPDGATLATGSVDVKARLWDVSNLDHSVELVGNADNVYAVVFHPDGHTLATTSHGLTVRLWETDADRAAKEVCELTFPTISRDEWDRHLFGYDYRPPCAGAVDENGREDREAPAGSTRLVAGHSGKCVAIRKGVAVSGAPAYQFRCKGAQGADWNLEPTGGPGRGGPAYRIRNASTGMCLDSVLAERKIGDASMVVQRPCANDSASQQWSFVVVGAQDELPAGRFVNIEHGDCLNVNGNTIADGAHIIRWGCGTDPNEIFRVSKDVLDG